MEAQVLKDEKERGLSILGVRQEGELGFGDRLESVVDVLALGRRSEIFLGHAFGELVMLGATKQHPSWLI